MRARIVVSAPLPEHVRDRLTREGFEIVDSGTGDLAVVALPELGRLRRDGAGVRAVVVAGEDDVVTAFAAGADDVVTPSVDPEELAARVVAILRRGRPRRAVLRFADVVVDVERREARRGGVELGLTATELRLLRYLLEHPRRALSKAEILEAVWPGDRPRQSNVVETYVRYLRRKLDAVGPPLIHTVRQAGYILDELTA